jgi:hypothetical protein
LLDPIVVDRGTLKHLTAETISLAAGPAAGPGVRARMARVASHRRDVRLPARRGDSAKRLARRAKH